MKLTHWEVPPTFNRDPMDQVLSDIGIISAYRFAGDGSGTKVDIANLETELK